MMEVATPDNTLIDLFSIAKHKLNYVYLGNMRSGEGQSTYCSQCKFLVIERAGYETRITGLNSKGHCDNCGNKVIFGNSI
jgi:pyruvate formate lyase activating enzyme